MIFVDNLSIFKTPVTDVHISIIPVMVQRPPISIKWIYRLAELGHISSPLLLNMSVAIGTIDHRLYFGFCWSWLSL